MSWKKLPYWLKGGIIALFIEAILIFFEILVKIHGFYDPIYYISGIVVWFTTGDNTSLFLSGFLTFSLVIILSFLIGAVIGLIVGKIKSKRN